MARKKAFMIPKDLEDGISQTIGTAERNIGELSYEVIPLRRVILDPDNPRMLTITPEDLPDGPQQNDPKFTLKTQELESLQSLSQSIKSAGVRHAIEVYREGTTYKLISGERRVLASLLAGKHDIQARVLASKPNDLELKLLQWIENIERQDLTIYERIKNVEQLVKIYETSNSVKISTERLSQLLGCATKQAKRYLTVMAAPPEVQEVIKSGGIADLHKLALIANSANPDHRLKLIEAARNGQSREKLALLVKQLKLTSKLATPKKARGRPRQQIQIKLASDKQHIVKRIFDCVLSQSNYQNYSSTFSTVDWRDVNSVNKALKSLFQVIDKVETR